MVSGLLIVLISLAHLGTSDQHGGVAAFSTTTQQVQPKARRTGTRSRSSSLKSSTSNAETTEGDVLALEDASTSNDAPTTSTKKKRVALLACPAQFCVPDDYECLFDLLSSSKNGEGSMLADNMELGTCVTAPLPRTEWIKVARQLPTAAFFKGELPVEPTLRWYFDAIEAGLAEIFAQEPDEATTVCIVGHSIGGWVARAYLGGLSCSSTAVYREARERVSSLVTLGTPHVAGGGGGGSYDSETSSMFMVDQTRGLLAAIDAAPSCTPAALQRDLGIDITCVGSSGLKGKLFSTNVEELIAASSYLPQLGRLDDQTSGDGIVPLELAFLEEPARRVVLDQCTLSDAPIRHAHVLPTPWNLWDGYAPSIRLPKETYPSYVTEGVVHQWAKYIR